MINNFFNKFQFYSTAEGYKEAAEKFQEESGVESSVDLSTLDNRILIREAVQTGRIQESISLVNSLHPGMIKIIKANLR